MRDAALDNLLRYETTRKIVFSNDFFWDIDSALKKNILITFTEIIQCGFSTAPNQTKNSTSLL